MKLSAATCRAVYDAVDRHSAGLAMPRPEVAITEYHAARLQERSAHRPVESPPAGMTLGGVACKDIHAIAILVERHRNRKDLMHTVAHEMVHLAFPSLDHGPEFNRIAHEIQRGEYDPDWRLPA